VKYLYAALAAAFTLTAMAQTPSTAKSDCNELLNAAIPLAEQLLEMHGEFYPYGAAMKPDGEIVSVAADNGEEHPHSAPLIAGLKGALHNEASKGAYKATAIVYDVRVIPPGATEKTDAIAVALDHQDHYSVVVYFPYHLQDSKLTLGSAFANAGEASIFPR